MKTKRIVFSVITWAIFVLLIVCLYKTINIYYFNEKTSNDIIENLATDDQSFQIQYQVKGLESMAANDPNKTAIMSSIQKAFDKVKRIITKSNNLNYQVSDPNIPVKTVNDLYITITLSDENIKEESGAESKDTVGGSNIVETKTVNDHIFPVIGTIQMMKTNSMEDVKATYDVAKYPHTAGLNRFYYVLLHEILHVLGVGFLWTEPDYVEGKDKSYYNRFWITDAQSNPAYVGPALSKYNGLSASVYHYAKKMGLEGKLKQIPIEDNGEPGTKLWHWEQGYYKDGDGKVVSEDNRKMGDVKTPGLDNELMVGWGTDKAPYLSTVTIANLEDLGYQVNYNEADNIDGSNGTLSIDKTQGTQGTNETQGTQGTQGTNETQGTQGTQGTEGTQGTQGTQATDGTEENRTTDNKKSKKTNINEKIDDAKMDNTSSNEKTSYFVVIAVIVLLIIIASLLAIFFI